MFIEVEDYYRIGSNEVVLDLLWPDHWALFWVFCREILVLRLFVYILQYLTLTFDRLFPKMTSNRSINSQIKISFNIHPNFQNKIRPISGICFERLMLQVRVHAWTKWLRNYDSSVSFDKPIAFAEIFDGVAIRCWEGGGDRCSLNLKKSYCALGFNIFITNMA